MKRTAIETKLKRSFSLSELTESIRVQIDRIYQRPYWIKAEINRLNYFPQSGHCYPELVEKRGGKIVAQIRGMIFRNSYLQIEKEFKTRTGKSLEDGMEVLFLCKVRFNSKYGLSLFIEDIDPSFTLGEMARMRSEAIKRLQKEGIFESNRTKYLPKLIRRLAVISVETSKGWRDFTEVLENSPYGSLVKRNLFGAKLQGDEAVQSIGKALDQIRRKSEAFDAVAIIRGGGGETGMDCYDNYELAKAVCTFPLPVLSGIGHSTNLTVVEMCSRKNLITPTALASFVIDEFADFELRILSASRALKRVGKQLLPLWQNRLEGMAENLERSARERLRNEEDGLIRVGRVLEKQVRSSLEGERNRLYYNLPSRLNYSSKRPLQLTNMRLEKAQDRLFSSGNRKLSEANATILHLEDKLRLLDPVKILKRGYSITMLNGKALTSIDDVNVGSELVTHVANGYLFTEVKNKEHGGKTHL